MATNSRLPQTCYQVIHHLSSRSLHIHPNSRSHADSPPVYLDLGTYSSLSAAQQILESSLKRAVDCHKTATCVGLNHKRRKQGAGKDQSIVEEQMRRDFEIREIEVHELVSWNGGRDGDDQYLWEDDGPSKMQNLRVKFPPVAGSHLMEYATVQMPPRPPWFGPFRIPGITLGDFGYKLTCEPKLNKAPYFYIAPQYQIETDPHFSQSRIEYPPRRDDGPFRRVGDPPYRESMGFVQKRCSGRGDCQWPVLTDENELAEAWVLPRLMIDVC